MNTTVRMICLPKKIFFFIFKKQNKKKRENKYCYNMMMTFKSLDKHDILITEKEMYYYHYHSLLCHVLYSVCDMLSLWAY
jgi:hypothetical protein